MGLGGAEKMLGDICMEFHRRGHTVKIVTLYEPHFSFDNYPEAKELITIASMEQVGFNASLKLLPPGIKVENSAFKLILDRFQPNIIHSHLFQSELLAHSVLQKGAVYFSHIHDNMFQLEHPYSSLNMNRRVSDYFERHWLLKQYDKLENNFIAISGDTYDFARRVLPSKLKRNVSLLRNAFNHSKFLNNKSKVINKQKPIRLISVGNLVPKKNHKLLIEICKCLQRDGIPYTCDILGHGELEADLRELINREGFQNRIFLRGSVTDVAKYLHSADIYVHTASYEPFGLVILEAMAAGLPVICRNGRGNLDLHVEGVTGYMIDGDDSEEFLKSIKHLIENSQKYNQISKHNIEFSKQYDMTNYCDRLIEIYRSAINKRKI